jgi:peptidoglycan/LPS O-acetylase OafA/YrhL
MTLPSIRQRPNLESQRASTLDGVRGLASLSVVFLHVLSMFLGTAIHDYKAADEVYRAASFTPVSAIWAGGAAVNLFFVLSGYALYSMLASRPMSYLSYVCRRFIRLWLPYIAAILLAVFAIDLFGSRPIDGQSPWLNSFLGTIPTVPLFRDHAILVGDFDTRRFDFVIWSLVVEMRGSLLFPLLFLFVRRFDWRVVLIGTLAISLLASLLQALNKTPDAPGIVTVPSNVIYLAFFVVGALIARNRTELVQRYALLSALTKAALLVLALCLYTNAFHIANTYSCMLGSASLIWMSLSSEVAYRLLTSPVVQFLGRISYSLYLIHAVVLLALLNALWPRYSLGAVASLVLPLSLMVATLLNLLVEQPAIYLSRTIGARVDRRRVEPANAS